MALPYRVRAAVTETSDVWVPKSKGRLSVRDSLYVESLVASKKDSSSGVRVFVCFVVVSEADAAGPERELSSNSVVIFNDNNLSVTESGGTLWNSNSALFEDVERPSLGHLKRT